MTYTIARCHLSCKRNVKWVHVVMNGGNDCDDYDVCGDCDVRDDRDVRDDSLYHAAKVVKKWGIISLQ